MIAVLALSAAFSCKKEDDKNIVVSISADPNFKDGAANVKVFLYDTSSKDVTVNITVLNTPSEGYTALSASDLEFHRTVTIPAGEKSVEHAVKLSKTFQAGDGKFEAVLSLFGAVGATVSNLNNTVHIVVGNSYDGGGEQGGEEEPQTGDMTLVNSWSVDISGDPYVYEGDGESYQDLTVSLSGIKYFWMEALTDAELAEYGTLADLAKAWADDNQKWMAEGDALSDIVFSLNDGDFYVAYPGAGTFKVYIIEFNADGSATGRYGVSTLTFAEMEGGSEGGDDDESGLYDVVAINGTGDAYFYFDLFDKGSITNDNLQDAMKALAQMCNEDYESAKEWEEILGPIERTDCMYDAEYNSYDYEELELGEYGVLIVGLSADGNLTGEYNLTTVTIDGHEYEMEDDYDSFAKRLASAKRAARRNLGKRDFTPVITGALTQKTAWVAEYLGRHEADDDFGYFKSAKKRSLRK